MSTPSDAMRITRRWVINGTAKTVDFAPLARLLDVLRGELALISVKEGCGEGECGTCTVLIDGELQLSCLIAAGQLDDGTELLTAEGLEEHDLGRRLQQTFDAEGAVQCGYCSPAMMLASYELLQRDPEANENAIREALAGHLCRCTGYTKIVAAVAAARQGAGVQRR
jgi:carbon-monoxide dehydrogenase small subunit